MILDIQLTMRALIHLHPRLSYLYEAAFIGESIYGAKEFVLLEGPSSQSRKTLNQFTAYIEDNRYEVKKTLAVAGVRSYFRDGKTMRSRLRLIVSFGKCIFSPNKTKALKYAARDSLITKRWRYLYLLSWAPVKRLFEWWMQSWGEVLRLYYLEVLREESIGCVLLSHPCYIPFIALIEAAIEKEIPCIVIGDGVVYKVGAYAEVYNARSVMPEWLRYYSRLKKECNQVESLKEHKSSLANALNQVERVSQKERGHKAIRNILVIFTHCVRDCNHIGDPKKMLFENYFEWMVFTAYVLCTQRTGYDVVIFKMHPASKRYGDKWFLVLLAFAMSIGRNRKRIKVLNDVDSLSDQIDGRSSDRLVPVTFHGSIALESACLGIKSICAGGALAPRNGAYLPASRKEYMNVLLEPLNTEVDTVKSDSVLHEARELKGVFSWGHFPDYVLEVSKKLDRFYYFGSKKSFDSREVAELADILREHRDKPFLVNRNSAKDSEGIIFFR